MTKAQHHHQRSSSFLRIRTWNSAEGDARRPEEPDPDVVARRRLPHDPFHDRPRHHDEGSRQQEQQERRPRPAHGAAGSSKRASPEVLGRRFGRVGSIREPLSRPAFRRARLRLRRSSLGGRTAEATAREERRRHAARPPGRGHRSGLRHPAAPVRRSRLGSPQHLEADVRGDVRRPRQHHPADHRARVGLRDDRQDARGSSASTGSGTARTPATRASSIAHSGSIKVAGRLGRARGAGQVLAPDRRPAGLPAARRSSPAGASGASSRPRRPSTTPTRRSSKSEIEEELGGKGEYIFDIPNFRQQGMEFVLDQVFKMTERRFKVARRLVKDKPWDFFMMVEMGMDRLHHVFWHYFDPKHPLYKPGNPFEDAFQRYYRALDDEVGTLLELLPEDAITIVMSDHGARPMMGGICFNDWLIENGYLDLEGAGQSELTPIAKTAIDWGRTDGMGRRRLLRPALPERRGARAAGRDRAGRVRDRARRARRPSSSRCPGRTASRSAPRCTSRRTSIRRSGAWRRISSCTSATSHGARWARSATRACTRSRTTSDPTAPTTIGRASSR